MALQRPTRLVMGPCIVQYQLEVNRCRNEENIVKGNFGWAWPMWAGCHRDMGVSVLTQIRDIEIDCIVIREVQNYDSPEIIVKGNFGWAWPILAGRPRIDHIVIREVQYQFEVNRCRNEEIIVKLQFWVGMAYVGGAPQVEIDRIVIREVQYLFKDNLCRNEDIIFQGSKKGLLIDGQTDRRRR
ncbi:hypothetical protein DPMN_119971 [Dreissena polymorpha]|uniref:Uncharacterized protein n=1 Tax=Dreissena polymorpha TaxID=45954 RepID=A0A9D4GK63_DREPO|nr:hypothetical protein DPMN_119971 [Dreissena polymorpha]